MLKWQDAAVIAAVQKGAQEGIVIAAGIVRDEAVRRLLTGPKTGRAYKRRGVTHQASAPGEAPASDTGRLAQSRSVTILPGGLAARVSFGTVYARPLELGSAYQITGRPTLPLRQSTRSARQYEFGTQTLGPRPFLRVSLLDKTLEVQNAIISSITASLGGKMPAPAQLSLF